MLIRWVLPPLPGLFVFRGLSELEVGLELRERSMCGNGLFRIQISGNDANRLKRWLLSLDSNQEPSG